MSKAARRKPEGRRSPRQRYGRWGQQTKGGQEGALALLQVCGGCPNCLHQVDAVTDCPGANGGEHASVARELILNNGKGLCLGRTRMALFQSAKAISNPIVGGYSTHPVACQCTTLHLLFIRALR